MTSIVVFIAITVVFYAGIRPPVKLDSPRSTDNIYIFGYLILTMLIQWIINSAALSQKCSSSWKDNIGAAALYTFVPWTLLFGAVLFIISAFPVIKSAFSDVIGYYVVSSKAQTLLTDLLISSEVESKLDNDMSQETKEQTRAAADIVMKIFGNASLLINQIVPDNFDATWAKLVPLMKQKYINSQEGDIMKTSLFDLVAQRDRIGEFIWYIYTGVIVAALVQMKISLRNCSNSPATMQSNYQSFLESETKAQEDAKNTTTTYVHTS